MNRTELIKAIAEEIAEEMLEHIEKLEPLTNGEVVKAVFPNAVIRTDDSGLIVEVLFSNEVWNEPYKGGE